MRRAIRELLEEMGYEWQERLKRFDYVKSSFYLKKVTDILKFKIHTSPTIFKDGHPFEFDYALPRCSYRFDLGQSSFEPAEPWWLLICSRRFCWSLLTCVCWRQPHVVMVASPPPRDQDRPSWSDHLKQHRQTIHQGRHPMLEDLQPNLLHSMMQLEILMWLDRRRGQGGHRRRPPGHDHLYLSVRREDFLEHCLVMGLLVVSSPLDLIALWGSLDPQFALLAQPIVQERHRCWGSRRQDFDMENQYHSFTQNLRYRQWSRIVGVLSVVVFVGAEQHQWVKNGWCDHQLQEKLVRYKIEILTRGEGLCQ